MAAGLKTYLGSVWGQALLSWRKGAVVMTALISAVLVAGLYAGWQFSVYPTAYFVIGTAAIAGFDLFALFPYQLWKSNTAEIERLVAETTPKLKCTFAMDEPGCVCPNIEMINPDSRVTLTWFRLKVEAVGTETIIGCRAHLTGLRKDGKDLLKGESAPLPFSPMTGTDTIDKTIRPKVPEYLDIIAANSTHGVIRLFRGHLNQTVDWSFLFDDAGDYVLHIVINSNNSAPYEVDLNFTWTLDPDTSTIFPVRQ